MFYFCDIQVGILMKCVSNFSLIIKAGFVQYAQILLQLNFMCNTRDANFMPNIKLLKVTLISPPCKYLRFVTVKTVYQ